MTTRAADHFHQHVLGLPSLLALATLLPQLRAAASTMAAWNMAHSDSMLPAASEDKAEAPPKVGVEDQFRRVLSQTLPADPYYFLGPA